MAQVPLPAFELPKIQPERVMAGLTQVPPKISALFEPLKAPEEAFEKSVLQATGFTPPPGPQSLILMAAQTVEAMAPALPFALPGVGPASTPTVPGSEKTGVPRTSKVEEEPKTGVKFIVC